MGQKVTCLKNKRRDIHRAFLCCDPSMSPKRVASNLFFQEAYCPLATQPAWTQLTPNL